MLTKRPKEVLEFVKEYSAKHEYAPSLDEIRKRFRFASVSTAHFHVQKLRELGYLKKDDNKARSINVLEREEMISVPLVGTIAAGKPIEAIVEKETITIPKRRMPRSGDAYALRVSGDSMVEENIEDGDVVVVRAQSTAVNGEKVVALIDNERATLKTFYKERGRIRLQPANKALDPIILNTTDSVFAIQGVVVDVVKNASPAFRRPVGITERLQGRSAPKHVTLPIDQIICGDAVEVLRTFPDHSIDLVVTSPPYDAIRDYKGFRCDLHATGMEIHRVLKSGGIAVMVLQDQTVNFGKTLTTFRTILDWCDRIGFKLFECAIYRKYGAEGAWWNKRFRVDHEYMPIFLKGDRPQYFNKEPLKVPSKHGGKTMTGGGTRLTNGVRIATRSIKINPLKCRVTIWEYLTAGDGSRLKHLHPATFPNRLPYDFIQCFCPTGGIVLDPFAGSGTTTVAAKNLGMKYIGIDIAKEYCDIAKQRIAEETETETETETMNERQQSLV